MQLMLLQSWGDKIRVFPAVPKEWKNITFDGLLAAGGFEVSAKRSGGIIEFIRIKSRAGEPCILKTEMIPDRIEGIKASAVEHLPDGCYRIDLKKGQTVMLFAKEVERAIIEAVEAKPDNCNTFGLKGDNG